MTSAARVTVRAQAKLNLRLAILARETSGYHAIETVFHRIELADDVTLTLRPPHERSVTCSVDVGPAEDNLAYRAAVAYLDAAHWDTGFELSITKHIPAGGGLGGGSADAAATLRALDALAPSPLAHDTVLGIGANLGADVPFLAGEAVAALAWGRGTRMLALDPLPQRYVALVLPDFRVATAEAYSWLAESRMNASPPTPVTMHPWHVQNWGEFAPWAANDFTPVIAARYPAVLSAIAALRDAGALIAGMTGSGSTLFGIFDAPPPLAALQSATGFRVLETRTAMAVEAAHRID